MKFKSLLLLLGLAFMVQGTMLATPDVVNLEDSREGIISLEDASAAHMLTKKDLKEAKKLERAQKKTQKKMARMQKFMKSKAGKKMLGGLDDPVDKWFWFWIIGWGAGIILYILAAAIGLGGGFGIAAILALFGWLAWLFGIVSFVIWLVKKFS